MTIHRKIKNKERCGLRGGKKRYSVWRAKQNEEWERICKARCEIMCKDHNLNIEEFKSKENRNTWEHTLDNLEEAGYTICSKSWRDNQYEDEQNQLKAKADKSLDYLLAGKAPPCQE